MSDHDTINRSRRALLRTTTGVGCACAVASAYPFLASLAPSERARAAAAPVEVDIARQESGELQTVAWRGTPVWILKRTPEMLAGLSRHDALLADPNSDQPQQPPYCANPTRSIKPEIFVCVGICTHLGCSPTLRLDAGGSELGRGWPGGFFCPCHGSKFDLAGRVFRSVPAPTNLVVPPHRYVDATRIIVGEDRTGG